MNRSLLAFTLLLLTVSSVAAYPRVVVLEDRYPTYNAISSSNSIVLYNPYVESRSTTRREVSRAYDDGYEDGYDDGYDDGRDRDRNNRLRNDYDRYDHCRPYNCQYEWFNSDYTVAPTYYPGYYTYPRSYVVPTYSHLQVLY
jgi:hypothetical protein